MTTKKRAASCECGACKACKKREYLRQYREANRERLNKRDAERYAANRDEERTKNRARYAANPAPYKARAKAWQAANAQITIDRATEWNKANPEKRKAIHRKYTVTHPEKKQENCRLHRERHPEFHKKRLIEWRKLNPAKNREYVANRRARTVGSGGNITADQIAELYDRQKGKCAGCRQSVGDDFHLDHVMPLALGGAHSIENAQILCALCNQRKHAKHPDQWAAELGRLFA
jgi:hypothetical protein